MSDVDIPVASQILSATGLLLTALGLWAGIWHVRRNHDKSRREYAARLIWEWTINTRRNTHIAVKLVDRLGKAECDKLVNAEPFELHKEHESLLKACLSETNLQYQVLDNGNIKIDIAISSYLRSMIIGYLNLLEATFVAWYHRVGDDKIIDEQFRSLINPKGNVFLLEEYRKSAGGSEHYPMIHEYIEYLNRTSGPKGNKRLPTA